MTARVSRPAEQSSRPGRLWWLPAGGQGNGLDDDAWAPVLEVSQRIVPVLARSAPFLAAAGVGASRVYLRPGYAACADAVQAVQRQFRLITPVSGMWPTARGAHSSRPH